MTRRLRYSLITAFWLVCGMAAASGLQVSPITLTLPPTQNADGLWLSNTGDNVVSAQIRVYRWTQEGFEDKLTPSRGLLVSPPMLQLPAEGRQLIRAIRAGAPPNGAGAVQEAYRIIIDELPVDTQGKKGLQFVLRYSVPIFVQPAGEPPIAPQLRWAVRDEAGTAFLEVANSGGSHAQLADLSFTDTAGRRTAVHAGLLGYVLPGAKMRWALKPAAATFTAGGSWEAMINGNTAQQNIQTADSPR
ncbi:molecular chaperone [Polaromonas sp.]|uniref:fimbrial biogenesis chaperone n=1 Tax=Polaromonas sp. TaxID=1869339 RepID=UPI00181069E8|nr:molecular chaperone [Polaromonas sp.]NML86811.1 molecular chaperone [Polaromonas sp.]